VVLYNHILRRLYDPKVDENRDNYTNERLIICVLCHMFLAQVMKENEITGARSIQREMHAHAELN
jgi:hypothetical protein